MSTIAWTPQDVAAERTLQLDPLGTYSHRGWFESDRQQSRSWSRKPCTVVHEVAEAYAVEILNIDRRVQVAGKYGWVQLVSFLSHLARGGKFEFRGEDGKTGDTTIDGLPPSEGDASLTVADGASTTGIAAGDWIRLEHANDPTRHEVRRVKTSSGTTITLHTGVSYDLPAGSRVRHFDFFPSCALNPGSRIRFVEAQAGRGQHLWNLAFVFVGVLP